MGSLRLALLLLVLGCCPAEDAVVTDETLTERQQVLKLGLPEHTVLVQKPFVVISNLDAATQARALRTIA